VKIYDNISIENFVCLLQKKLHLAKCSVKIYLSVWVGFEVNSNQTIIKKNYFFLLQKGRLPIRDLFLTHSLFSWPRSGDCEGCRIRSRDCSVGSLDLLASAISTEPPQPPLSHHNPTEPPQPHWATITPLSHHNPTEPP
jgi:hypothetical protein